MSVVNFWQVHIYQRRWLILFYFFSSGQWQPSWSLGHKADVLTCKTDSQCKLFLHLILSLAINMIKGSTTTSWATDDAKISSNIMPHLRAIKRKQRAWTNVYHWSNGEFLLQQGLHVGPVDGLRMRKKLLSLFQAQAHACKKYAFTSSTTITF